MEDIYTIKVKTNGDPRARYPSERRYSASTVFGLAWVHLALAATTFLLACLALVNPNSTQITQKYVTILPENTLVYDDGVRLDSTTESSDEPSDEFENSVSLIIAPCLLTLAALASGLAAVLASKRWYIDQNIAWLFAASLASAVLSLASLCMTAAWIASTAENNTVSDYFNDGMLYDKIQPINNSTDNDTFVYLFRVSKYEMKPTDTNLINLQKLRKSRRVLSINILIAAILELLWSLLTVKIAWKGMRRNYPDDDTLDRRGGNCLEVVTEIKGNNTKYLPKNAKILPPKPDLITQYPTNGKIKKFFIAQQELGNDRCLDFPRKESNSEYRERMFNFLNRCTSFDQGSICASEQLGQQKPVDCPNAEVESCVARMSWGDSINHSIYDQNTLTFEKLRSKLPKLEITPDSDTVKIEPDSNEKPDQ